MINKKAIKYLLLTGFVLIVAAIQTYSLWLPVDEKVDESELVYFAVGFFGGDFDPHWYNYGGIGMYLLYIWYMILYLFHLSPNHIENIDQFTQLLFATEFFIDYGRYLFSIIGVITIIVYSKILYKLTNHKLYPLLFIGLAITAQETILFANYIRSDQIVALFVSLLIYALIFYKNKKQLYLVAFITGALISAKVLTLFLGGILAFITLLSLYNKTIQIKHAVIIVIIFFLTTFVFQPFQTIIEMIMHQANKNTDIDPLLGGLSYTSKLSNTLTSSFSLIQVHVSKYLLFAIPALIFLQKKYYTLVAITLLIAFLLVLPISLGNGVVRYYWLNSIYDLIRFLGVVALINLVEIIVGKTHKKKIKVFVYSALLMYVLFIVYINLKNYMYRLNYLKSPSNKALAKIWVQKNLYANSTLLLDGYYNHVLPKIYDPKNIPQSKSISRVFTFNRHQNDFLNSSFEKFLSKKEKIINYKSTSKIRIDFNATNNLIKLEEFYVSSNNNKISWSILKSKDINNLEVNANSINFNVVGKDAYLVFELDQKLKLNEQSFIHLSRYPVQGPIEIFYDLGFGFNQKDKVKYINPIEKIVFPELYRGINRKVYNFDPAIKANLEKVVGSYFITSPAIYKRLINHKIITVGHRHKKIKNMNKYYNYMLSNPLIKEFKSGTGPRIQIYLIKNNQ